MFFDGIYAFYVDFMPFLRHYSTFWGRKWPKIWVFWTCFWPNLGCNDRTIFGHFYFKLLPWIYWELNEDEKPLKNRWERWPEVADSVESKSRSRTGLSSWVCVKKAASNDKSFFMCSSHTMCRTSWGWQLINKANDISFCLVMGKNDMSYNEGRKSKKKKKEGFFQGTWERVWTPFLANFFLFCP